MSYFIEKKLGTLRQFSIKRFSTVLFGVYGALWLFIEASAFFSTKFSNNIKGYWWLFLVIGIIAGLIRALPKLSFSAQISKTDTFVEIRVTDMFAVDASYIMGTTCTFDTSLEEIISPHSTQGQFTERFFDSVQQLNAQLESSLKGIHYKELTEEEKNIGKKFLYPFGTVAKVEGKNKRNAYLAAFMTLNEKGAGGKAEPEDFNDTLPKIWKYIREYGDVSTPLCCGVLGSAFSRLKLTREELIRKIVKSFITASRSGHFCEGLIIAIYPSDYKKGLVNLEKLRRIIEYECYYND